MAKRRGYREGSIYQRASDGMWVGTIEAGWTATGARRRITVSGKTEAVARRRLRDKRLQIERDGNTSVSARSSVKTWAAEWLAIVERDLSPAAFTATRSAVNRWIVPTIGHRRFDMLTPADVRAVAKAQRGAIDTRHPNGRSSSTQRRTHSVLMQLLKAAQAEGYPVPVRVLAVKAPEPAVNDRQDIPVGAAARMIALAERTPGQITARWLVGLLEGMRQAEVLGLRWSDLDLEDGTIAISWQLQTLRYRRPRDRSSGFRIPDGYEAIHLHNAFHLVRPKSEAGRRVVPMVPWVHTALLRWRPAAPTSPHDLAFPRPDGQPCGYKDDDAAWYALQDAASVRHPAGRRYTIHEARHTTAQLLLEAEVDPLDIVAILGHTRIDTSRIYMRTRSERMRAALDRSVGVLELGELFDQPG